VRLVELLLLGGQPAAFGFLERHGDGVRLAFIAQIPKGAQVTGCLSQSRQDLAVGTHRSGVVLAAGTRLGRPDRPTVRDADDLDVAAMVVVFSRPPQVHLGCGSGRGHPVGLHQDAIDVHVAVPRGLGRQQRPVQARCPGSQHDDALVRIVVAGRLADPVVHGQLLHPGAVQEPAQYQHRLVMAGQRPGLGPGAPPHPFGPQQLGQEVHRLVAYRQHRGVCDTRRRRTLMKLICRRTTFVPGFCVFLLHHNGSGVSPYPPRTGYPPSPRYAEWLTDPLESII
jgi:hypothetical protein